MTDKTPPVAPVDAVVRHQPIMDFVVVYGIYDCLCEVDEVADGFVESYTVYRLNEDGSRGQIMQVDINDEVNRRYRAFCESDVD